ncbi:glycoside hydrolase family 5 protein [Bosea sp. PAMC 26642]|uniref:glycoside hydrolase family 5 protein n=1 Tax=Bosea sp. (strain PAMC 26642) TaxID=1792307 RepID=UPI00076FF2A5|nr:cellulase family glycosylhydrolase [Bosea sp. PAMC 26642]AMJ62536.1 hypothetical protein AXW83_21500 [Bosea sp. PAMC 26642]
MASIAVALLVILASLTFANHAGAQATGFKDRLSRGINLAHWFAQTFSEFSYDAAEKYITPAQVDALASAGFTHVRLPVVMGRAFAETEDGAKFRSILIDKINLLNDRQLAVVLDIHPTDEEKGRIDGNPASGALAKGWALLARELSVIKPDRLAFEVMNEPFPMKGAKWAALQEEAARAIRAAAPEHAIIVNPGSWSSMDDYKDFKRIDLPNLIYTVHIYDPNLFTHQGAAWGWTAFAQVQALDWPIAPGSAQSATDAAAQGEARGILTDQIRRGMYTEGWLRERIGQLKAWQNANGGVPIWVGEFGVYRKFAPREARLRWHKFMREEFDRNGWGWAVWDYLGDFGVLKAGAPNRQFDDELIGSLGLRTSAK